MNIHPYKIDINEITLTKDEIDEALKALSDNLSQSYRIKLNIDGKAIYIYNSSFSGKKRVSDMSMGYDDAMRYIHEIRGAKTSYTDLRQAVIILYNSLKTNHEE